MDRNPLFAQESACSTDKLFPQTHFDGILEGGQPYPGLVHCGRPLYGAQNYALLGRVVSHFDDPFSVARSMAVLSGVDGCS